MEINKGIAKQMMEMASKYNVPQEVIDAINNPDDKEAQLKATEILKGMQKQNSICTMQEVMKQFTTDTSSISVWGDNKHRNAILNPVRVIINDKTDNTEAEVIVTTDALVYRITTTETDNFKVEVTKINENMISMVGGYKHEQSIY